MNLPSPKVFDSDIIHSDNQETDLESDDYTTKSKLLSNEGFEQTDLAEEFEFLSISYDQRGFAEGWEKVSDEDVDCSSNESDFKKAKSLGGMPVTCKQYYDIPYGFTRKEIVSSFGVPFYYYYKNSCFFCFRHFKCCCCEWLPYNVTAIIIYAILFGCYFTFVYIPEFSQTAVCFIFFNFLCDQFVAFRELFIIVYRVFEIPLIMMLLWIFLRHFIYPSCGVIPYHRMIEKTYRISALGKRRRDLAHKRKKHIKRKIKCNCDYCAKYGCSMSFYLVGNFAMGICMVIFASVFYFSLYMTSEDDVTFANSPSLLLLIYISGVYGVDFLFSTFISPCIACFMTFQLDRLVGYRTCFNIINIPKSARHIKRNWKKYVIELPILLILCFITQFIPILNCCSFPLMLITFTRWNHHSRFIDGMGVYTYHKRMKKRRIRNYHYKLEKYMERLKSQGKMFQSDEMNDDYYIKKKTAVVSANDFNKKGFFSQRKEGRAGRLKKIRDARNLRASLSFPEEGGTDSEGGSSDEEGEEEGEEYYGEGGDDDGDVDELVVEDNYVIEDEIGNGFLT